MITFSKKALRKLVKESRPRAAGCGVLTALAQEVTFHDKSGIAKPPAEIGRARGSGGGPAVSSELYWVHGRYCEDNADD